MPRQALVEPQNLLPDAEAVRVAEAESCVVDDHAHVADVVVDPLELEEDDAEPARPRRHGASGERLERLAVGEDVPETGVPGDPLGERRRLVERKRLEELLRALVDEAESRLEIHDRLSLDAEAKVPGLDDAGVDRPDGDLEDALTLDMTERKRLARIDEVRARRRVAPQRVIALRPVLMEGQRPEIRMPVRDEAEQVVDLALKAAGCERTRREGGKARCGRRNRDEHGHGRGESRGGEHVCEREIIAGRACVRGGEELTANAE